MRCLIDLFPNLLGFFVTVNTAVENCFSTDFEVTGDNKNLFAIAAKFGKTLSCPPF